MVKVKYVGTGLFSNGIHFRPDKNDGLYDVDEKTANYLIKTFNNDFILIEKKSNTPVQTKKKTSRTTKTRRGIQKKVD